MKRVAFTILAVKQFRRLDATVRARIEAKVETYAATGAGDIKRLTGRPGVRLRVGDWRVILTEDTTDILITDIGHRSQIYK